MRNISKTLENKTKVDERLTKTKNRLISASNSDIDKLLDSLNTTKRGIESEHIVEENQDEYGKNIITKKGSDNISKRLVRSFFNLFNIILIVLALVSCVVEIIIPILNKTSPEGKNILWTIQIASKSQNRLKNSLFT